VSSPAKPALTVCDPTSTTTAFTSSAQQSKSPQYIYRQQVVLVVCYSTRTSAIHGTGRLKYSSKAILLDDAAQQLQWVDASCSAISSSAIPGTHRHVKRAAAWNRQHRTLNALPEVSTKLTLGAAIVCICQRPTCHPQQISCSRDDRYHGDNTAECCVHVYNITCPIVLFDAVQTHFHTLTQREGTHG